MENSNRVIKFRAWDKKNRKFLSENDWKKDLHIHLEGGVSIASRSADKYGVNVFEIELTQYTGLKDKNGKEIYEGDIVKFDYASTPIEHNVKKVYWEEEWACWKFGNYMLEPTIKKTLEVVGNIYENKKLIK